MSSALIFCDDSNLHISISGFFQGVLGTRFGSLELQIGSLESAKIIIGSLESEKSGPYRSIPGT